MQTDDLLDWMHALPIKHKILIAGNHERNVERYKKEFVHLVSQYDSITYLHNTATTIDGVKFYGSPYSNEFYNWAFMEEEVGLSKIWAKIPNDTDVLITHGPSYGCLDLIEEGRNVGSESLRERKEVLDLKLHVSGHIHEAYGVVGNNVCASVLNRRYELVNEPIVVEI